MGWDSPVSDRTCLTDLSTTPITTPESFSTWERDCMLYCDPLSGGWISASCPALPGLMMWNVFKFPTSTGQTTSPLPMSPSSVEGALGGSCLVG